MRSPPVAYQLRQLREMVLEQMPIAFDASPTPSRFNDAGLGFIGNADIEARSYSAWYHVFIMVLL